MMGSKTKTDHELDYEDLLERQFGSPLLHASSDWPISSVNVGGNKLTPGSSSPSSFAQRQQRPRSPVPAAAAIHERHEASRGDNFAEVTYVPVATAGPCRTDCQMVMPFMVLLFFMTLLVAVTQVSCSKFSNVSIDHNIPFLDISYILIIVIGITFFRCRY